MNMMRKRTLVLGLCAAMLCFLFSRSTAAQSAEQQALVDRASLTMEKFLTHPDMSWFRDHVKDAKGLLIVPQMLKGAFFIGGSGGSGVLVVRDATTGEWSQPVFYTLGSASFGLQFGGQASELVLMVMTPKGTEALYTSSLKLGGDASIAAGPMGVRLEGATPMNLSADYLSFALSKGAFVGISLDGALIEARDRWNEAYYGKQVRPVAIFVERSVNNPGSARLLEAVRRATLAAAGPAAPAE